MLNLIKNKTKQIKIKTGLLERDFTKESFRGNKTNKVRFQTLEEMTDDL